MQRTRTYSGLTLRLRSLGESNREVSFLTAEEGILHAVVYGGPKSKLRSHAAPFHSGTLWIYHDPVRDSRKLSDFDVLSWRPGLRELYERSAAASAVAETILTGHGGGGGWDEALRLAESVLDALENADEKTCTRLFLFFLWTWALLLGQRPSLDNCASCACEVSADGILWFVPGEGPLCSSCCKSGLSRGTLGGGAVLTLGPGARRWLLALDELAPAALARISPDDQALREVKAFVTAVLAGIMGKRLSSWDF